MNATPTLQTTAEPIPGERFKVIPQTAAKYLLSNYGRLKRGGAAKF